MITGAMRKAPDIRVVPLCEVRSCEEEYLVCENAKGNGERIVIFNEQKGELYDRINRR